MSQQDYTVRFPFGDADVQALSATGEQALVIDNTCTIIDGKSVPGTGDRTIDLTIGAEMAIGSQILVEAQTTGAHNTIFGTGFADAEDIVGTDGDNYYRMFIFDGINFVPAIMETPQGAEVLTIDTDATQALTVNTQNTIIDGVTTEADTNNRTLNLTIGDGVLPGAKLLIKCKTNGSETTVAGTGIAFPTVTGSAGKTWTQGFTYDGTNFLPDGAKIQID